jgi:hypothetical protein
VPQMFNQPAENAGSAILKRRQRFVTAGAFVVLK